MPNQQHIEKDRKLWLAMLDGDKKAFAQIYQRYSSILVAYGAKIYFDENIIKDAIHDIFVQFWDKRKTAPHVVNLKMYLFKAFRNRLYRLLEKHRKFIQEPKEESSPVSSIEDSIVLTELKKEHLLKLHFHLQNLPIRQREIIHLKFFQNLTPSEIAELMDINYQSVCNGLYRGMNTLRSKFRTSNMTSGNKKIGK